MELIRVIGFLVVFAGLFVVLWRFFLEWVYDFEDVFVKIVMIIVFSTVLSVILFFGVGILPEGLYMISRTIPG